MRDLHNNIKVTPLLDPIVVNNTSEGTPANGVDVRDFQACELIAILGATGDTLSGSVKIELILKESDDDSTYTIVTDANDVLVGADGISTAPDSSGIFATIDANTEDERQFRIGYRGNMRYAMIIASLTGTHTNGTPMSIIAVQHIANIRPATD